MKETVLQTVKIVCFAILFSAFLLFSVLALTPERSPVQIQKEVVVSASPLSVNGGEYLLEIKGTLKNTSSKPVLIDGVEIRLTGVDESIRTTEPIILQPRTEVELFLRETANVEATSVKEVTVLVVNGEVSTVWTLRNPAVSDPFGYALLPTALALVFLLLLIHAIIVRVYMAQEKKI